MTNQGNDIQQEPYRKWVLTGHITVPATGTHTQLPDRLATRVYFKPHPDNTGHIWLGQSTGVDVGSFNAWPVEVGDGPLVLEGLRNLNVLWVNFDVLADRLVWLVMDGEIAETA